LREGWAHIHPLPGGPPVEAGISQEEADYLQEMARGKRVLEVGSAFGGSTIAMALHAAEVVAIDPHQAIPESLPTLLANLRVFGVEDRVRVVAGSSHDQLPLLIQAGERFDLVYIDGDHAAAAVLQDAKEAPYLANLLIFHDYGSEPEVAPILDQLFPAAIFGRELHGYLLTIRL